MSTLNIEDKPNSSLFTDFADQHRYTIQQYMDPHQGAGLNRGCPGMKQLCKPNCPDQFFCENSSCPMGYVRAAKGMCYPNDGIGELKPAIFD